jgi:hypothetical protein
MSSEMENNETESALLLMYLVNELSSTDQEAVEHKLEADPALRARLEQMRAEHEAYLGAMRTVDSASGRTISHDAAAARACRLIRQWSGGRTRVSAPMKKKEMRVPWWSYPLVAAAAVLVAVVFWGLKHHEVDITNGLADQPVATGPNSTQDQTPTATGTETGTITDTSVSSALAELTPDQQDNLLNAFARGSGQGSGAEDATDLAVATVAPDEADGGSGVAANSDDLDIGLMSGDGAAGSLKETR